MFFFPTLFCTQRNYVSALLRGIRTNTDVINDVVASSA